MKQNDLFSSSEQVYGTLRLASMTALRCLDFLQKYLPVDEANAIRLDDWVAKFQAQSRE